MRTRVKGNDDNDFKLTLYDLFILKIQQTQMPSREGIYKLPYFDKVHCTFYYCSA